MLVFELVKQWLFPPTTIWGSHVLTISFTGCLAFIVSYVVLGKLRADLLHDREALRMAHRQAEFFIDAVPSILIGMDQDSRITRWNSTAAVVFGLPEGDVVGKTLADCGIRWQRREMEEEIRSWSSERVSRRCDEVSFEVNGETHQLGLTITPVQMSDENLTKTLVIGSDVTERKRAQEAVKESEERYRLLFERNLAGVIRTTMEGRVLQCNQAAARMFGYDSPEEVLSLPAINLYPSPSDREVFLAKLEFERSLTNYEMRCRRRGGDSVWVIANFSLVGDERAAGEIIEGTLVDITERKRAEEEIRDLLDAIPEGVYGIDLQGRCTFCNPSCIRLLGYEEPEELLGLDMHALMHHSRADGSHYPVEECHIFEAFRRGQGTHIDTEVLWRRDRTSFSAEYWSYPIHRGEDLVGAVVTFVNINERKRAEKELRFTQFSLENASDAVFWVDPQARVMYANEAACQSLGHSREDLLSLTVPDIDPLLPKEAWLEFWEKMKAQGSMVFETQNKNKEGRIFPVEVTANYHEFDAQEFIFAFVRDITARRALEGQLRQAQKLEGIGQLAAGIAHEINTPTQYIGDNVRFLKDAFQDMKRLVRGYEQALAADAGGPSREKTKEFSAAVEGIEPEYLLEEIPKAIDQTLEGVSRVAGLVNAMKEFSHPGTKDKIPLDLNHAIENTLTVARNEWKYVADVETDFDPSLPLVPCLVGEFNQVILNLIVNAAHAIADVVGKGKSNKGKIRIQTRECPEWVEIRIQDTGSGIPEKVRARIYDPFFTTKEVGKGTGQGLAIARSVVVDKHGGTIHFETEEGKGTTFTVRLPHTGKDLSAKAGSW
jgi:PAS domain S-box-containing protein